MISASKKILEIDLKNKTSEVKSFSDFEKYVGGVGLGLKLLDFYLEKNPIVFTIGPLNGFFPYASKTCVVLNNNSVIEDLYVGGGLSLRMRYAGISGIVIYGESFEEVILEIQNTEVKFLPKDTNMGSLGLPGKRSYVKYGELQQKIFIDGYFTTPENYLEDYFKRLKLRGFSITGTETFTLKNLEKYQQIYQNLLLKKNELSVLEGNYPSCANCPMGCGKSRNGELGGNVLIHSLVACQYADNVFSDVGIVFSCLNVLGYDYTHEDIENLPKIIEETIKNLTRKI